MTGPLTFNKIKKIFWIAVDFEITNSTEIKEMIWIKNHLCLKAQQSTTKQLNSSHKFIMYHEQRVYKTKTFHVGK